MEAPRLIENKARTYIYHALYTCRENRIQLYSTILNVAVLVTFLTIFGIALYYCHTKQMTPYDKRIQQLKDQEYIMLKIREQQIEKAQQSSLTNLPEIYSPVLKHQF
jgi:uncharacterized protein HemX